MKASNVWPLILAVFATGAGDIARAEEAPAIDVVPIFQLRPRGEKSFAGPIGVPRSPTDLVGADEFRITQRTRVGLLGKMGPVAAQIVMQDVRAWGSEANTLSDFAADSFDMHEAFFELGSGAIKLRGGRQEVNLDGQRLMGAVDWTQQGRSFDGLRLLLKSGIFGGNVFWSRQADGGRHDLFVFNPAFAFGAVSLSVPLILQTNDFIKRGERGMGREARWTRFTGGAYVKGEGDLSWRIESYLQAGQDNNLTEKDILAFMIGARIGYKVASGFAPTLWVDFLSGDGDPSDETYSTFDTLFATNHKFYGFMDRFLAIPGHTRNGGLIDLALKNDAVVGPGKLHLALHEFIIPSDDRTQRSGALGLEVDLIYTVPITKNAALQAGMGLFFDQGDYKDEREAYELMTGAEQDTFHDWWYLQLDVKL